MVWVGAEAVVVQGVEVQGVEQETQCRTLWRAGVDGDGCGEEGTI